MSLEQLLVELTALDIRVWAEADQLCIDAPKNRLTSALKAELVAYKSELLTRLQSSNGVVAADETKTAPLSFTQESVWFLNQLDDGNAYNEFEAITMEGPLNLMALQWSFDEIVRRHEILRTTFPVNQGVAVQMIYPPESVAIPVVDLRNVPSAEQDNQVQELAIAEAQHPFDLAVGPLLRVKILHLNADKYVLFFTMHHICGDGWSIGKLSQELETLYTHFVTGAALSLPDLPLQYADYAEQQQQQQDRILETQLDYWKTQLAGVPTLLTLSTDRPRPAVQTHNGCTHTFEIPTELTKKLTAFSNQQRVTLFMTTLTAFNILLHRYSRMGDIVVGSAIANRNRLELEHLIGFFTNTLALRTTFSDDITVTELLQQVRQTTLAAYNHADLPFEKVVSELQPERSLSYNPLFQVMFTWQHGVSMASMTLPGLTITPLEVDTNTAKFDMSLSLEQASSGGLHGTLEYNTDLFDSATMVRLIDHFQRILAAIVNAPEQRVSTLNFLGDAEQHQLLVEWNDTHVEYPDGPRAHELVEAQAAQRPKAIAIVSETETLTYHELNTRANKLAHFLQAHGVGPNSVIGLYLTRSPEMIVGMLAAFKVGAAYMPIDPVYPAERISFLLQDVKPAIVLTQARLETMLIDVAPPHLTVWCTDRDWSQVDAYSKENLPQLDPADRLAYVIYTSGSTGTPKGTLIPHSRLLNLVFWHQEAFEVTASDRVTHLAGVAFDASVWEIWPYLMTGARLYLGEAELLASPRQLRDWLLANKITITFLPTPLAEQLLLINWPDDSALRILLTGGDALHYFPDASLPFRLVNNYGPTECAVVSTSGVVSNDDGKRTAPTLGRPVTNCQIYIVDQHLQPVPIGVPGEICIGGDNVGWGYLNRPQLTAEKFIPDPFSNKPGAHLYKTGDLARYLPDGTIEFLGRIDTQVKIRGFRVELGEIEAVLGQHPQVEQAVVIAREDVPGNKRLVAYVTPTVHTLTSTDLQTYVATKLPGYMVPSAFVVLDTLPLTPNGKINRQMLPAPEVSREAAAAPRDALELKLTQLWEDILKVPVGIDDDFFEIGGHSLLVMRLVAQIRQHFDKKLPASTLFQYPTVSQLASLLRQQGDSIPWSPLVPIQPQGTKPPLFAIPGQGGMAFYYHELAQSLRSAEQPLYALQAPGLDGETSPLSCVEDLAAYYIDAIRTVQPEGPYRLAGHSFGAYVAFEMARQLQQENQPVEMVAVLDMPVLAPGQTVVNSHDNEIWLEKIISIMEGLSGQKLSISYEALRTLTPEEQVEEIRAELIRLGLFPSDVGLGQVQGIIQVLKADDVALSNYIPTGDYIGEIIVLRAAEPHPTMAAMPKMSEDESWGWQSLTTQPVEVVTIPGNHATMLKPPSVQMLAERLQKHMEKIEDE